MTEDRAPEVFADVIARLKECADEDGAVTTAQIDEALGPFGPPIDIKALFSEIERSGLHWNDQDAWPHVIPPDYPGLRIVRTETE